MPTDYAANLTATTKRRSVVLKQDKDILMHPYKMAIYVYNHTMYEVCVAYAPAFRQNIQLNNGINELKSNARQKLLCRYAYVYMQCIQN